MSVSTQNAYSFEVSMDYCGTCCPRSSSVVVILICLSSWKSVLLTENHPITGALGDLQSSLVQSAAQSRTKQIKLLSLAESWSSQNTSITALFSCFSSDRCFLKPLRLFFFWLFPLVEMWESFLYFPVEENHSFFNIFAKHSYDLFKFFFFNIIL